MSLLIGSWEFEGPYTQITDLRAEPGIVAILSRDLGREKEDLELVEIQESESVRNYLETKLLSDFSPTASNTEYATAVYYCSDLNSTLRQGLIDELMKEFNDGMAGDNQYNNCF